MSKWDKLLEKICSLSRDLRFDELRRVLESYGVYDGCHRSGSSPLHIPKARMPADYDTKA